MNFCGHKQQKMRWQHVPVRVDYCSRLATVVAIYCTP